MNIFDFLGHIKDEHCEYPDEYDRDELDLWFEDDIDLWRDYGCDNWDH